MSKKKLEIAADTCVDKTIYHVSVYNAILHEDCFNNIDDIIKELTVGEEMFFGFYRVDGLTLSNSEFLSCGQNLPLFFKENGEYKEISETVTSQRGKEKKYDGMLTVARARCNQKLFDNLKWILQYYLETTFFVPNIEFDKFEQIFSGYMKQKPFEYLHNNYTNFEFSYYDSGNFSVYFNPDKVSVDYVKRVVERYFADCKS